MSRQGGKQKRAFGTIDIETDPFLYGRMPKPFCCGVFTDETYCDWWGDDCIEQLVAFIEQNPGDYYAHNGGRFDFHYLIDYTHKHNVRVINGRIAKLRIGESWLIDSYMLAPFSLDTYKKTEIDYAKFEPHRRERHRREILSYLHDDCRDLHSLVRGFHETLGKHLTIGGAAFARLKSIGIEPPKGTEAHDNQFRPFYFGGRTQAFKRGHYRNVRLQYLDINSAYPWAMLSKHPMGLDYELQTRVPRRNTPYFIVFDGTSRGALPYRDEDSQSIDYSERTGTWRTTSWEFEAAQETNALTVHKVREVWVPKRTQSFEDYVYSLYELRKQAKAAGDRINELAFKYLLNSAYGKFATNPSDFCDYTIIPYNEAMPEPWEFEGDVGETLEWSIWSRPSLRAAEGYYDVATAASITGKVRAHLWTALCAGEPWYCDTDSIIGANYRLPESDSLGDWKSEGDVSEIAIAGRKLYAAKVREGGIMKWKTASKGSILDHTEVIRAAKGETVEYQQDAPVFSLDGRRFITRLIRST